MFKLIRSLAFKIAIVVIVIILLIGHFKLGSRIKEATRVFNDTHQAIYESDQYILLPEPAKNGIEVIGNKLYFINKVSNYYNYIFLSITVLLTLIVIIEIILHFKMKNRVN